jgi:ABC-2 type transport system ATP-binding protein
MPLRDSPPHQLGSTPSFRPSPNGRPDVAIQVDELTKRYKDARSLALDSVSFQVRSGELFALLGPNGAGKTTTVAILTTVLSPTSGRATVSGYDVVTGAAEVRRRSAVIFQQPSLDLNLTAEENVRFHAILYGLYPYRPGYRAMPAAYRRQVQDLAAIMGIAGELHKPLRTFSGGMRRKLEIVRSLIHRPAVLFLDEPTTGLDPASRRSLWAYLRSVREDHQVTLFLTTHYLEEAEDADRVGIINKGRMVVLGTPQEVKAALVDRYVWIDAADRAALRAELAGLGVNFEEHRHIRVRVTGEEVHRLLRSIETPLTSVETHFPTLEDAYLAVIGQGEGDAEPEPPSDGPSGRDDEDKPESGRAQPATVSGAGEAHL